MMAARRFLPYRVTLFPDGIPFVLCKKLPEVDDADQRSEHILTKNTIE